MGIILAARRMLSPSGLVDDAWIEVDGQKIAAWGVGRPPAAAAQSIDGLISPGFVDVHSHGGGGANFADGADDARRVLATHLAQGTTTMLASVVTNPLDDMAASVEALTPLVGADEPGRASLAGIHLEGPWLSPQYKGAHEVSYLRDPGLDEVKRLASPVVRLVTMAPEREGALTAIEWLVNRSIVVAVGHTAADYACAKQAIAAGATGATHLFNAMPDILHRAPGPALALWQSPDIWVELVCDGAHVAVDLIAHVMATKPGRCVFVTDAMAAAGASDGDYHLGGRYVQVRDGVARLAGLDTIAGSTLTLSRAVQVAVRAGIPLELALLAATAHPADYIRLTGVGRLQAGNWADLVVMDDDLEVRQVMHRGEWV